VNQDFALALVLQPAKKDPEMVCDFFRACLRRGQQVDDHSCGWYADVHCDAVRHYRFSFV